MEFRPYSKAQQLAGHQKTKDKPKPKEKKPKKKKKKSPLKPEIYKGRRIPTKQQRGKVTKKEYNEALRVHGEACYFCNNPNIEMHHVMPKGYSRVKNGRGKWRNLRALCPDHHRGTDSVHQNKEKMEQLQLLHESLYGPFYFCDKYDLFKMGLIQNTADETFEEFMRKESEKCQLPKKNVVDVN